MCWIMSPGSERAVRGDSGNLARAPARRIVRGARLWRGALLALWHNRRPSITEPTMNSATDPLRAARSLRSILEAQADATDGDLTITKPCIEALTEANLFHVMVP